MDRFNKKELVKLKDFRERVIYLFENTWRDSRRKFCDECHVGRTTFYGIWKGVKKEYSDYIINKYAKIFDVSFEFMKYGGDDAGHYYDIFENRGRVREKEPVYGAASPRKKTKTFSLGRSNIIITTNDPEGLLEILMRIKYKDIDF